MKFKNILIAIISTGFVLFFQYCEKETSWDLETQGNNQLVVEAIFTNELVKQEVRLSQSYDSLNGTSPKVNDAFVSVEVNGFDVVFLADTIEEGLYKSIIPFRVFRNLDYILNINWEDEIYTSESSLSTVAPLPNIFFRQFGNTDSLTFVNFASPYNPNQQAMYEVDVDWSAISGDSTSKAKTFFYTFSTIDESEILPPPREDFVFPRGSIVYIKKYGLNDDFAEYLRSLLLETVWNGNFLYSASASLPTNISNDGLGFFSACAVVKDTLIAE